MGVEIGTAMIVGTVVKSIADIQAGRTQSQASKRATTAQTKANEEALAFEKERDALDRDEARRAEEGNMFRWRTEQDRDEYRWGVGQEDSRRLEGRQVEEYNAKMRNNQPYRDTGRAALGELGRLAGLQINYTPPPQQAAPPGKPEPFQAPRTPGDLGRNRTY